MRSLYLFFYIFFKVLFTVELTIARSVYGWSHEPYITYRDFTVLHKPRNASALRSRRSRVYE